MSRVSVKATRFPRETGLLVMLISLGLGLRVLRLGFQPLWWDEGYSVWFATHPLGQMAALTAQDIHPPLYYALLHGWTRLLGTGPVALRLLSVAFGVLAIPAIYLAGRKLLTRRAAWLATLLLVINPLHIFYSQEVRMYGLVALLSAGILAAAGRAFEQRSWEAREQRGRGAGKRGGRLVLRDAPQSPHHRVHSASAPGCSAITVSTPLALRDAPRSPCHCVIPSSVLYILLTTAALYTQYYAVFLPIGLTLYALWRWRRDGTALLRWLGAQVIVAVLYLPWVIYAGPKLVPYVSQKVVHDSDRPLGLCVYFGRHLAAFLAGHLEGSLAPYWPVALVLLVPLGIGWWLLARGSRGAGEQGSKGAGERRSWGAGERGSRGAGERRGRGAEEQGSGGAKAQDHLAHSASAPGCSAITPSPPHPITLLAVLLATALTLGWLIGLRYPFFPERGERLLLLALPPFILLAAAGLDALWSRSRLAAWALIGALAGASLWGFYTVPRYTANDYRPLIARTIEQGLPEDTVFCVYPWQVGYWRSYGDPAGPNANLTPDATWSPAVSDALDAALARGRVWFPAHLALGGILETQIEAYLAGQAVPFVNAWYGPNTRLSAWAAASGGQPVDMSPVRFSLPETGAVELTGVTAALDPVPAANAVTPVTLRWSAPEPPPVLGVSVRLVDDLGQIWAQHDYEPLGNLAFSQDHSARALSRSKGKSQDIITLSAEDSDGGLPAKAWQAEDRLGLLIPVGTPPGLYAVELAVRRKDSPRPLEVQGLDGAALGTTAHIFDITIIPADRALGPERLPIAVRQPVDLEDGLRFLGYSAGKTPVAPGELRKVSLFWQATGTPAADYTAFVQLLDSQGGVAAGWEAPPGASYPTSQWTVGTLIRTQAAFRLPAALPDGRYRLIAGLFNPADGVRSRTASGADHLTLGTVTVRGRPHALTPPQPAHAADVRFGEVARLVGYDLALPAAGVAPGDTLPLTLYWQATGTADRAYTVFVHLLDQNGALHGYGDAEPAGGQCPTTGWLPGEYLTDPHAVVIDPDTPAGTYRLALGLYDPATGQRLTTPGGADQVVLDVTLEVRSKG